MTRTLFRRGRLALAAGWTLAAAGPVLADSPCAQWFETAYHRYPKPAGVLRPCSCFGYFATQWQPWPCPTATAAAIAPGTIPAEPATLPTPTNVPITPLAPSTRVPPHVPPPAAPTSPPAKSGIGH
jgi:hypothetical protein